MGEIISTLRKEKGMTQKELADRLNLTDKAVSKWERDAACPDTQLLPKLAEIFGVSIEDLMNANDAVGRKLDFLIQEMNREVNTIGSKCADAEIAHRIVEAKNELEKIREQIQNLE
jgi:transcriptional regulator with XRE-family HTH domain